MAHIEESSISCGVVELHDLSKRPRDNCADVLRHWEDDWFDSFAYVIFSDVVKVTGFDWASDLTNNGTKLAKYIEKYKLGTLASLRSKKNPNSGNVIKVWLWSPNMTAIRKVV